MGSNPSLLPGVSSLPHRGPAPLAFIPSLPTNVPSPSHRASDAHMGDGHHPGPPHPHLAPGLPLWLCLWVQVSADCGQGKWTPGPRVTGMAQPGTLPFPPCHSSSGFTFPSIHGHMTGQAGEVPGTTHSQVFLLSSRLYRKWKEKIPNPSKSLLFQVGSKAPLLAPCPIMVTMVKDGRPSRWG